VRRFQVETNKVGISDISMYIPPSYINLDELVEKRVVENEKLSRHLDRAVSVTGQRKIRFPEPWEDTSTLAAEAARKVLEGSKAGNKVRYFAVGTETTVDHSKPVASYAMGMLQRSGVEIGPRISTFQVQHACAGGTIAMLGVSGLINTSPRDEKGLVVCSDIARYTASTTAEITQGSGSVALLVEKDPKLLELDLGTIGYSSEDVDDFFRPLGSREAVVKGGYSIKCYNQALETSFLDHCDLAGETPKEVLENADYVVLHTPFKNMPIKSFSLLVQNQLGITEEEAADFLESKSFAEPMDAVADIGNIYTGSAYLVLAFLLDGQYKKLGKDLIGKTILLGSYGSGNTMAFFKFTVAPKAAEVLENWNLQEIWDQGKHVDMGRYEAWLQGYKNGVSLNETLSNLRISEKEYQLSSVRDDGYREYR
jgi:hydroxymethylglutaryl-CoA synthase